MKVFLDECVDRRLWRDLTDHQVMTARQMGWTSIKNGELLALASREFDVFVTADRNLSFQQNLGMLPIAVIVLSAPTNRLADVRPLVPRLLAAIASAAPGNATIVGSE
jgi:predicted nuclease of predicted toxin-antitoxin system